MRSKPYEPVPSLRLAAVLVVAAVLVTAGCTRRANPHAVDTLYLTPEQEKDVFVASDHLGPDSRVVVLASVPKARYENGAIVLTGGREMEVVQPDAWRTYTGTALSVEEAQRMIARAEHIDQAVRDVGAAASDLRGFLESRSREAKAESERMRRNDEAWRADQERQAQTRLDEASRVHRARDQECGRIVATRDDQVAAIYQQGAREIEAASSRFIAEVDEINERDAKLEARAQAEHAAKADKLAKAQKLEASMAEERGDARYLHQQQQTHERQRQDLAHELDGALETLRGQRDDDVARVRAESARQLDDARRLTEEKAERVRAAAERQLDEVRAGHALPDQATTSLAASPPADAPAMASSADAAAARATPGPAVTAASASDHAR